MVTQALAKTGFLLEHDVAHQFKAAGWSTINGRYYLDDVDGVVRELDMVAYKVVKTAEIDVVTAVLLSCKKDASNTWAFMSRDRPVKDPNFDWNPVHQWTDVQPLRTYLSNVQWTAEYVNKLAPLARSLFQPSRDIFAYQQVSDDGRPQNDKPIFSSVSGLMKALDHEINALSGRVKGRGRIYQFNLATVVDAPLVDVSYDGPEPVVSEVESIVYFARYMVRKREVSGLVHFIRHDKLRAFIERLDSLAVESSSKFPQLSAAAYGAILTVPQVLEHFSDKLGEAIKWRLWLRAEKLGLGRNNVEGVRLGSRVDVLLISLDASDEVVEALENDKETMSTIRELLRARARYEGKFVLDSDVPF